jgi:hypothetical protein
MEVGGFKVASIPLPKNYDEARDKLAALSSRISRLRADLAVAKSPDAQTHLQRESAATDRALPLH